jgi:hypothetical protein
VKYSAMSGLTNRLLPFVRSVNWTSPYGAADRGCDLAVDGRGVGRSLSLGVVDRVQVELRSPALSRDRERAEVGAVLCEGGDVLQDLGVDDAMEGIDAESEAGGQLHRALNSGEGGERGHVLLRGTEPGLIPTQQEVRAAVHQDYRVDTADTSRRRRQLSKLSESGLDDDRRHTYCATGT